MKRGGRLPDDQAEIAFSDVFVEQMESHTPTEQVDVLADVVGLCTDPAGKHPLSKALAGWNTLAVLSGTKRVVYRVAELDGVGLIEVLCIGPRSANEVYDIAVGLIGSGALSDDEATQLWEALSLLDVVAESVGLDGWDYRPPPAPDGMIRAAVASGLLTEDVASLLSLDELEAAMAGGWSSTGADPIAALSAALRRARGNVTFPGDAVVYDRAKDRCGAVMPRAQARCIRVAGHPGAHRAR